MRARQLYFVSRNFTKALGRRSTRARRCLFSEESRLLCTSRIVQNQSRGKQKRTRFNVSELNDEMRRHAKRQDVNVCMRTLKKAVNAGGKPNRETFDIMTDMWTQARNPDMLRATLRASKNANADVSKAYHYVNLCRLYAQSRRTQDCADVLKDMIHLARKYRWNVRSIVSAVDHCVSGSTKDIATRRSGASEMTHEFLNILMQAVEIDRDDDDPRVYKIIQRFHASCTNLDFAAECLCRVEISRREKSGASLIGSRMRRLVEVPTVGGVPDDTTSTLQTLLDDEGKDDEGTLDVQEMKNRSHFVESIALLLRRYARPSSPSDTSDVSVRDGLSRLAEREIRNMLISSESVSDGDVRNRSRRPILISVSAAVKAFDRLKRFDWTHSLVDMFCETSATNIDNRLAALLVRCCRWSDRPVHASKTMIDRIVAHNEAVASPTNRVDTRRLRMLAHANKSWQPDVDVDAWFRNLNVFERSIGSAHLSLEVLLQDSVFGFHHQQNWRAILRVLKHQYEAGFRTRSQTYNLLLHGIGREAHANLIRRGEIAAKTPAADSGSFEEELARRWTMSTVTEPLSESPAGYDDMLAVRKMYKTNGVRLSMDGYASFLDICAAAQWGHLAKKVFEDAVDVFGSDALGHSCFRALLLSQCDVAISLGEFESVWNRTLRLMQDTADGGKAHSTRAFTYALRVVRGKTPREPRASVRFAEKVYAQARVVPRSPDTKEHRQEARTLVLETFAAARESACAPDVVSDMVDEGTRHTLRDVRALMSLSADENDDEVVKELWDNWCQSGGRPDERMLDSLARAEASRESSSSADVEKLISKMSNTYKLTALPKTWELVRFSDEKNLVTSTSIE